MKYVYPAIFTPDDNDTFCIRFPDIGFGATMGEDLLEGMQMAQDFLANAMVMLENEKKEIPTPTDIKKLVLAQGEFSTLVTVDTMEHRRKFDNTVIKKTLTMPSWLNARAEAANINFSQTLQRALKEELQIAE
jgi:predicted RNase H-like HicB family nuclease